MQEDTGQPIPDADLPPGTEGKIDKPPAVDDVKVPSGSDLPAEPEE